LRTCNRIAGKGVGVRLNRKLLRLLFPMPCLLGIVACCLQVGTTSGGTTGGDGDGGSGDAGCALPCKGVPCCDSCDEGTMCCQGGAQGTFYCCSGPDTQCPRVP